jgi:lipopolysaccharide export system protein LptA
VDAKETILISLTTNDIHARGSVGTVSTGRQDGGTARTGIFNAGDKLYGSGAEFWYDAAGHVVRYLGAPGAPARLTQGDGETGSVIVGDEITFAEDTQNLDATGHVESGFLVAPGSGTAAPSRYRVTARTLRYADATRTATYTGAPAVLTDANGETRANTLVLTLAAASRTLETLHGIASVTMIRNEGRQATADDLLYEAAKDVYILQGKPLTLFTRDTDGSCSVQTGRYARHDGAAGAPTLPVEQNPGGVPAVTHQPCPPGMPPARK